MIIRVGPLNGELIDLPEPSSLKITLQDIDASSTTRSANGTMLRDRVAGGADAKRKLELQWVGLDEQKVSFILQSIKDEFFQVEYPDTFTADMRTGIFYVGDRSADMYAYKLRGGSTIYRTLNANFIEQ